MRKERAFLIVFSDARLFCDFLMRYFPAHLPLEKGVVVKEGLKYRIFATDTEAAFKKFRDKCGDQYNEVIEIQQWHAYKKRKEQDAEENTVEEIIYDFEEQVIGIS